MIGCSLSTVVSLEVGRLPLSQKIAERISFETGVDMAWVLKGNAAVSPIDVNGAPYTKETFDQHRAEMLAQSNPGSMSDDAQTLATFLSMVGLLDGEAKREKKLHVFRYRLQKFIVENWNDFGNDLGATANRKLTWEEFATMELPKSSFACDLSDLMQGPDGLADIKTKATPKSEKQRVTEKVRAGSALTFPDIVAIYEGKGSTKTAAIRKAIAAAPDKYESWKEAGGGSLAKPAKKAPKPS